MKTFFKSLDPALALAAIATITTAAAHFHYLHGQPLSVWTAFLWASAVIFMIVPTLLDVDAHAPTQLARYALFACMLVVLKVMHMFGLPMEPHAAVILLTWRWFDVALMWLNWSYCQS